MCVIDICLYVCPRLLGDGGGYNRGMKIPIRLLLIAATHSISLGINPNYRYAHDPKNSEARFSIPQYNFSKLTGYLFRQPRVNEVFDYIVVGGGSAGCPLARTLSEAGYKVLLIERGPTRDKRFLSWDIHGQGNRQN